jgi:hypothetical protein
MILDSLLRGEFRKQTGSRGRVPNSWRPCLESLEQRTLPATLVLPQTDVPSFWATFNLTEPNGQTVQITREVAGGNFLGTLDGTTPLTASYCVSIDLDIFLTTYDNATVTNDGTIYGSAVPQAGAISWILTNLGPAATTPEQQDALQAAIWRTEYGIGFQLDGVDNNHFEPPINATIAPIYQADLAALGNNAAPVGTVAWISPGANPYSPSSEGQGLVALTGTLTSPPPEQPQPPELPLPELPPGSVSGTRKHGHHHHPHPPSNEFRPWIYGGLRVEGTQGDIALFREWLFEARAASRTFRGVLHTIHDDTAHPVQVILGHSQPHVYIDSFNTREVDLNALGLFPATIAPGDNQQTRVEMILHFLQERWVAARLHVTSSGDPAFAVAHARAIEAQNLYRLDLGQVVMVTAQLDSPDEFAGTDSTLTWFNDGSREVYPVNANGNLAGPGTLLP